MASKYRTYVKKGGNRPDPPVSVAIRPQEDAGDITLTFARTLREARLNRRMSRGELADEIGYSDMSILRWEHETSPTYPEDYALQQLKVVFAPLFDKFPYRGRNGVVRVSNP